jgi:3D (Asp-Asp-Asp) domain-containing protein
MIKKMSSMVKRSKNVLRKHFLDVTAGLVLGVVVITMIAPRIASADMDLGPKLPSADMVALQIAAMQNGLVSYGDLPDADFAAPRNTFMIPITAYNSEAGQTDDTPCIAARGFDLCAHNEEDVVAANFLPIGAKVKIPELYGDRVFTVVDRMNARYYYHLDIWMKNKSDAKSFGVKYATVEVF